ncbi:MAG: hypothetical protein J1F67_02425 [Muribaculaceae bacterium]|nr:hypothetical protein [Muribaculaceae bacterium]
MDIARKGLRKIVKKIASYKLLPPKLTVFILYSIETLRFPKLRNPKDLNEKLIWLAFNTDTTRWSRLTDKYEVRNFISEKGFANILTPLIGVFENADEIDFDNLPECFVIKSTNGTAQTIVVDDKSIIDKEKIKKEIKSWQTQNLGYSSGEIHYLRIPQRIIIEQKLGGKTTELPIDYKFMCINGKVHSCLVCSERDKKVFTSRRNLMEVNNWKEIADSVNKNYRGDPSTLKQPHNLKEMVKIAEVLSQEFPFVRVDLYEVEGKIYFGEMTFTPSGFHITSINRKTLKEMGNLLILPGSKS